MSKLITKTILVTCLEVGIRHVDNDKVKITVDTFTVVGKVNNKRLIKIAEENNFTYAIVRDEQTVIASMSEEEFLQHANIKQEQLELEI